MFRSVEYSTVVGVNAPVKRPAPLLTRTSSICPVNSSVGAVVLKLAPIANGFVEP